MNILLKLHTTDFEEVRLQKNILLREENPVVYAKGFIQRFETTIRHDGKNFYVTDDDQCIFLCHNHRAQESRNLKR
ncbi:DUF3781 domain-containing protein [Streptococcus pneumoniae]